ncbi:MAG: exopolysaccharide biosynthesis protein [Desulfobulbaceae bacterium]|nr:exopolysaccharide biosynthesis protein [Desulfobulbaceae bacterium]
MLDQIGRAAGDQDKVTVGEILDAVGSRSFCPLLLLAGIIMASPLSGIPGMPTIMAVFVLLIAVQLLIGRKHSWLPNWLLNRSITSTKLAKALAWLEPPARFIDRRLRPRLTFLVHSAGAYVIAVICIALAAGMPFMELVPFSATTAGLALVAFGLSLVAHDGFMAISAFVLTAFMLVFFLIYLF